MYIFAIVAIAVIFVLFALWLRSKDIGLTWYEWLIGIVGVLLLLWTVQVSSDSFAEARPEAGYLLLLIIGLPAVILIAVSWLLARRRIRA